MLYCRRAHNRKLGPFHPVPASLPQRSSSSSGTADEGYLLHRNNFNPSDATPVARKRIQFDGHLVHPGRFRSQNMHSTIAAIVLHMGRMGWPLFLSFISLLYNAVIFGMSKIRWTSAHYPTSLGTYYKETWCFELKTLKHPRFFCQAEEITKSPHLWTTHSGSE